MKKRILSVILCTVMAVSLAAGCSSKGGEDSPASDSGKEDNAKDDGYKLGISVLTMSGQFFIDMVDSAQAAVDEIGGELIVNDADNSSETHFISAGVDGIIVTAVDTEAVAPVIK